MAQLPGEVCSFFVLYQKFPPSLVFENASFPSEESGRGNEITAAPEKRADVISPAAVTDTRTITGNAAGRGTATASGIVTETAKGTGKGNIATAR